MRKRNSDLLFLDADDTLWRTEEHFRDAEVQFAQLLSSHADVEQIRRMLWLKQEENIPLFGYGSKTYLIGMIDAAISLCGGSITRELYESIKKLITDLSFHEVELIDGVKDTLQRLSKKHTMIIATKGDVIEQLSKVRRSTLAEYFLGAEVLPLKDENDYLSLCRKYRIKPEDMLMVGNSVRSDIIPVVNIGGTAIHIPYGTVWVHEIADMPVSDRALEVANFAQLESLLM